MKTGNGSSELVDAFKLILSGTENPKDVSGARYTILNALQKPFLSSLAHKMHETGDTDMTLLSLLSDSMQDEEKMKTVLGDIFGHEDLTQHFRYQIMPLMAQMLKGELPASSFLDEQFEQSESQTHNNDDEFYVVVVYDKNNEVVALAEHWRGVGRSPKVISGVIPRNNRDQIANMKKDANIHGSHTGARQDDDGSFVIYTQAAFSQLPERERIQREGMKRNNQRQRLN